MMMARARPAALGIVVAAIVALLLMGRPPICPCGTVRLWHGAIRDNQTLNMLMLIAPADAIRAWQAA